jgi:signal transduction histidine kinase/CheY-like chemotaxis protein
MTKMLRGLSRPYDSALRNYLRYPGEHALHQAYELGRNALGRGAGILDLVLLHHDSLARLVVGERSDNPFGVMALAADFLSEFLSPFEMTLRSYLEMNRHLNSTNAELTQANAAATLANELLMAEVAARERVEQALFHAQKLQAVGLLAGGVAHNFNNLLTVVLGNIDLARGQVAGNAKVDQFLLAAQRGAERGAEVTRELLTFSRQQTLQPRILALAAWLHDLAPVMSAALRDNITIESRVEETVWPIEIDPSQLELALLNLCVNARHAMPDGGYFRVSAENRRVDDERLGLNGDFVVISVSDTGQGIAPNILHRVFEPFFTTKTLDPGTGLGLSQVHGFVHQSGGGVEMESVLGEGATIHLYLPATVKQVSDAASDMPQRRPKKSTGNVLVVEDNIAVADIAVALLQECGYSVKLALRAQTALDMIQDEVRVDLIFSDVVMPGGMSGVQLAEEVRRRFPSLPILLTTGYSEAHAGAHAKGLNVISKPYRSEELCARIDEMLRAG